MTTTDPASSATPSPAPVALVTGTSTGIGLRTAVELAAHGYRVVATMRDTSRAGLLRDAAAAAGVELDVRPLDVTDDGSVVDCVAAVVADHGRLDAVVNNAGRGQVGTTEELSLADFRAAMEVNFFGVVRVTQAVLPHLRASSGHLLTVTSVGGVVGQPFNDAYCAAKFAAEGMLESLAPVAQAVGVRVSVLEPGAVASEFVANAGVDGLSDAGEPYGPLLAAYLDRTRGAFAAAQDAGEVAAAVRRVLSDPAPAFRQQTSDGSRTFAGVKLADLDGERVQSLTRAWLAP